MKKTRDALFIALSSLILMGCFAYAMLGWVNGVNDSDYNGTECPTIVNGQCVWGDSNAW